MSRNIYIFALLIGMLSVASSARAEQSTWRVRFLDAAVVSGETVRLGEVAVPVGDISPERWAALSARELWPSPPDNGKVMSMTRPRLQEAVVRTMPDLAPYCLFPGSMLLQRGGAVLGEAAVHAQVVKELTPYLASLDGEVSLSDVRAPSAVFLKHPGQTLAVEPPKRIAPGRLSIRLAVRELDGSVTQKLTGSVMVDCWKTVPRAIKPLNRDEPLEPTAVNFVRVNLAQLRETPWDGKGGPWRMTRPVGVDQVIYQSDVAHIPTIAKGTIVTLLYEGKTVKLSVKAEVLADGVAGAAVPVRNTASKKEVYAVVRDPSTVVVSSLQ